jgi:hypothetical protein
MYIYIYVYVTHGQYKQHRNTVAHNERIRITRRQTTKASISAPVNIHISHNFNKVLTKYIHIYVLLFYPDNSTTIAVYASVVLSFKHVLVLVVLTRLRPPKMDLGPKHV